LRNIHQAYVQIKKRWFGWYFVAPASKAKGVKRVRDAQSDVDTENLSKLPKPGATKTKTKKGKTKTKKEKKPTASNPETRDHDGDKFKGYSLAEVPLEAWPQPRDNKGKHGYTIHAGNGAVACISNMKHYETMFMEICPHILSS